MVSRAQISNSVWPFRWVRSSRIVRRVGSAKALKTSPTSPTICKWILACQRPTLGEVTSGLWWAAVTVVAVVVGGGVLHFVFAWTGKNRVVAVFAPVNESFWEHLKMAYWPALVVTAIQIVATAAPAGLVGARAIGFYTTATLMYGLLAASNAIGPPEGLRRQVATDTGIFVLAVVGGQVVCQLVVLWPALDGRAVPWALALPPAVVLVAATFAPPHRPLFRDQITGGYGIPR